MATLTMPGDPPGGPGGPGDTRRRAAGVLGFTWGRAAALGGVVLVGWMVWSFLSAQIVSQRPHDMKTTQVILPPPPPPPPPIVKPEEKPPEPTDAPPMEEPVDTPPPPDQPQQQSSDPAPGDNALTAREGAGPSNYGLAAGDGSGTRIGGRPGGGGNGFAAYAQTALGCIRRAAQADRDLSRGHYSAQLAVSVAADGRITSVRAVGGDNKRNERLNAVLTGLACPVPPPGLPVMRIELNARAGG